LTTAAVNATAAANATAAVRTTAAIRATAAVRTTAAVHETASKSHRYISVSAELLKQMVMFCASREPPYRVA
jgi:hypothetical protein